MFSQVKKNIFHPYTIIPVSTWLLLNVFLLYQLGIVTSLESEPYIQTANKWLATGHYPSGNFIFYSVQIMLNAFCIKTGIGFGFVVALQIALNGLSVILFNKLIFLFAGSKKAAFYFTLLFLAMYYYHLYNVHLYTESLYFSFSIFFTYWLFLKAKKDIYSIVFATACIVLLCLTRPTGIFFFPAVFLFFLLKFFRQYSFGVLFIATVTILAAFYYLLNFSMGAGGAFDFALPYINNNIICGVSEITEKNNLILPANINSVQGLFYLITHYPGLFFSLATKRFIAFWGMYRSHYSLIHNIFICTYFYTLYVLCLFSFKKMFRQLKPEVIYLLCIMFLFTVTVMLSCDEWHNRFIFSILPYLLLCASVFFNKKFNSK